MTQKQKALLVVAITAIVGGGTTAVTKKGLAEIPPLNYAFLRFFLSAIMIFPFFLIYEKHIFRDLGKILGISLFGALNIFFFILGISKTTATISQLIYGAIPVFTGIIMYIFLKEKLTRMRTVGIVLGFIGVIIVLFLPIYLKNVPFAGNVIGNISILTAVISWTLWLILSKNLLVIKSPFLITSYMVFVTAIVLFPFSFLEVHGNYTWLFRIDRIEILSLMYVSVISTIATFIGTQYAIKYGGTMLASTLYYLLPISAFVYAFFLLGEKLNYGIGVGSILVLIGTFLVTLQ